MKLPNSDEVTSMEIFYEEKTSNDNNATLRNDNGNRILYYKEKNLIEILSYDEASSYESESGRKEKYSSSEERDQIETLKGYEASGEESDSQNNEDNKLRFEKLNSNPTIQNMFKFLDNILDVCLKIMEMPKNPKKAEEKAKKRKI